MRHVARADAHGASHSRVVFVVQIIAAGGRSCWDDGGGSVGRRRIPPPLRPPQLLALRPRGTLGLGLRQRGWGALPFVAFICLLRRRRSQPLLDWFTARYGGRGRRSYIICTYVLFFALTSTYPVPTKMPPSLPPVVPRDSSSSKISSLSSAGKENPWDRWTAVVITIVMLNSWLELNVVRHRANPASRAYESCAFPFSEVHVKHA